MADSTASDIAITQRDFEELRKDVSASPLWNKDLAPTTIKERTWSTWNIAALWIGMSVVITTYTLAGGFIEAGMNWWQAMITILLGNTIVLIPMILNAHAGTKYGVSFPVLARASFGTKGANIPAILRAIVACGWFGIQTWIGGTAIDALFSCDVAWLGQHLRRRNSPGYRSTHLDCFLSVLGHSGLHHPEGYRGHQASRDVVSTSAARRAD